MVVASSNNMGGVYIGKHGVDALHRYKYAGVDRSFFGKHIFQPFWTNFVNIFPLWMPPNMITLMGFLFLVASGLLTYIYNPRLDSSSPNWLHFVHGLLLFLYQTFDAVDGKQARRTCSSSPLGELFDHGCDALTCAFETMAVANSIMSGRHTFWLYVIATIPFYGATWESFFTKALILPEVNGPTEGLMLAYMLHFFTAFVGPSWWSQNLRDSVSFLGVTHLIPDMPVHDFFIIFSILFAVTPTAVYNLRNVYTVVQAQNGTLVSALALLFPYILLICGITIWGMLSPSDIFGTQPHLVLLGTGFAFGFLAGRIIVAHLCDEPKGLKTSMCLSLLLIPLAIANALSAKIMGGVPIVDELWMLLLYCFYTVSLYIHFATNVIHEITSALGIHCFKIGRKEA